MQILKIDSRCSVLGVKYSKTDPSHKCCHRAGAASLFGYVCKKTSNKYRKWLFKKERLFFQISARSLFLFPEKWAKAEFWSTSSSLNYIPGPILVVFRKCSTCIAERSTTRINSSTTKLAWHYSYEKTAELVSTASSWHDLVLVLETSWWKFIWTTLFTILISCCWT